MIVAISLIAYKIRLYAVESVPSLIDTSKTALPEQKNPEDFIKTGWGGRIYMKNISREVDLDNAVIHKELLGRHFQRNLNNLNACGSRCERGTIPRVLHRTLLYDKNYPNNIIRWLKRFVRINENLQTILWREYDVLKVMTTAEKDLYRSMSRRIQRSDFARYVLLNHFGGM